MEIAMVIKLSVITVISGACPVVNETSVSIFLKNVKLEKDVV